MTISRSLCNVFYIHFLFLETQPPISLEYNANKIIRYPGSNQSGSRHITHFRKGHMGVNMSSLWQNTVFLRIFIIKIFILETPPLISLELLCYRLDRYPDSNKNGVK